MAFPATKPTFFLVPGACHTPRHYEPLITHLSISGYPTATVSLPSVNSSTPNEESVTKDSIYIRSTLEILLDEGKYVILAAHSYGGIPSSAAAKGFMKSERQAAGKNGGIVAQVYIAAFLAPEGVSLLQLAGGKHAPWVIRNAETGYITPDDPMKCFFADAPAGLASAAIAELKPSAILSTETPAPPSGIADSAVEGKRVYVLCGNDLAVPPQVQEMIVKGTGLEWKVVRIESGHCPMVSRPAELAKILADVAEEFGQ